jgi:hypothetical protein
MKQSEQVLRELASMKDGPLHNALKAELNTVIALQCKLKDEVELRWNQGKQQLLFEILDDILSARDRLEKSSRQKPTTNAF